MPENAIFSFRNWGDTGVLSGGSWDTDHLLSNAQNRLMDVYAQTTDAAEASSILTCTFTADKALQVVCLREHNLTSAATIKIEFLDSGGSPVAGGMSAFANVWDSTWSATEVSELPSMFSWVATAAVTCRAVKISIKNSTNSDGYIRIGRLWIGAVDFQPTINFATGAKIQVDDLTPVEETPGGTKFNGIVKKRLVFDISLQYMSASDGFKKAQHMTWYCGTTKQLVCILVPNDTYKVYQSILGTLDPQPLTYSEMPNTYDISIRIKGAVR